LKGDLGKRRVKWRWIEAVWLEVTGSLRGACKRFKALIQADP
jgi:hypothetical protein